MFTLKNKNTADVRVWLVNKTHSYIMLIPIRCSHTDLQSGCIYALLYGKESQGPRETLRGDSVSSRGENSSYRRRFNKHALSEGLHDGIIQVTNLM